MPRHIVDTVPEVGDEVYLTDHGWEYYSPFTDCRFATVTERIRNGWYTEIQLKPKDGVVSSPRLAVGPSYFLGNPDTGLTSSEPNEHLQAEFVYVNQMPHIEREERNPPTEFDYEYLERVARSINHSSDDIEPETRAAAQAANDWIMQQWITTAASAATRFMVDYEVTIDEA